MQKLERLLNLTAVLLHSGRPLTASDLRARVPGYPSTDVAFRRSFERDKDDLREMGVPLDRVEIPGADPPADGYVIPRSRYYLQDPGLEPDELVALQLAVSAVRFDGVSDTEALWKLGGVDTSVQRATTLASLPSDPSLAPLFEAVSTRSRVHFTYRDAMRTVDPYRIGFQRGHWYLRGHDVDRDDIRVFRIDRISGTIDIGAHGTFRIPAEEEGAVGLVPEGWQIGNEPPVSARIRIDSSHAALAHSQFDHADITTGTDGSIEVAVEVTNRIALRSLVLSYLEHAEILEPPELRDELIEWLRSITDPVAPTGTPS